MHKLDEVRTSNKDEMGENGKIGSQWQKFHQENIGDKIPNQLRSDELMAIYTDFASDVNGEFSLILQLAPTNFDQKQDLFRRRKFDH